MLKQFLLIRTIISFIIPYIIMYAFYIQFNGEISPGGGFQAGVIFASSLIGYEIVFGYQSLRQFITIPSLIISGVLGVLIYAATGLVALIFNKQYLDYSILSANPISGQQLGIFFIEIGVGITVSSIMCLIYILLMPLSPSEE